ncbi:Uncharacterised protein [Chlamydia abortus]|jgi:hypothetical protein|nr:Uncharacterised protein [Chlamydia abortus]
MVPARPDIRKGGGSRISFLQKLKENEASRIVIPAKAN